MNIETDEDAKNVLLGCAGFVVTVIATPFLIAYRGYVLSLLWNWFIVPVFGLRHITLALAVGLSTVLVLFRRFERQDEPKDAAEFNRRMWEPLVDTIIHLSLALMVGWAAHNLGGNP